VESTERKNGGTERISTVEPAERVSRRSWMDEWKVLRCVKSTEWMSRKYNADEWKVLSR
jgi:hypothetical protein